LAYKEVETGDESEDMRSTSVEGLASGRNGAD
jgi:hypothetical protein